VSRQIWTAQRVGVSSIAMDTHRDAARRHRRPYHHGDLRRALLDAAEEELTENGIEGFSLRGVAKRAAVSHAAPAHHFRDATGLLTALAALGFRRFVLAQDRRQSEAKPDALAQLIAAGLGYIDFATTHPALFRLMFSSNRPDFTNAELAETAGGAFERLVAQVRGVVGADPRQDRIAMLDVMAAWSMVHGIADLMNSGRAKPLLQMPTTERESAVSELLARAIRNRGSV
jgi:AcrR family transcriptional regulator